MHLLVLSAFRHYEDGGGSITVGKSQCTFWCSVLSDMGMRDVRGRGLQGLNAPSGAQCFPTGKPYLLTPSSIASQCTFWCSVLSDWVIRDVKGFTKYVSQCTFWCSVLSDFFVAASRQTRGKSQCTFWCSVLSDCTMTRPARSIGRSISMHLLVLSAFRQSGLRLSRGSSASQCTFWCSVLSD